MQSAWQWTKKLWHNERWLFLFIPIFAGLVSTFGLLAHKVMEGSTLEFDRFGLLAFRSESNSYDLIGPSWIQEMARDATALGSFAILGLMLITVAGYLLLTNRHSSAWLMLAAVLGGLAMNSLLKVGFARPRPYLFVPAAQVFTPSFPSGHAALSAITYLTLAALLARTTRSTRLRIYFVAIGVILTFIVGASRLYLGVHYPTDILAGWCIGSAWAMGCWAIMTWLQRRGQVEAPEALGVASTGSHSPCGNDDLCSISSAVSRPDT